MMLGYSLLLTLALVVSAPWWLIRMFTTARYREGLGQRLGSVPATLRAAVANKRVVWIHAVSVGEVLAASRLVTELEAALGEGSRIVISTTTRTGQTLARERFGADRVFYMPLDFAFAIRAYLNALKPAALILMESELWPRMLHECAQRNISVAVANARVSDRGFQRGMKVRSLWKHILRKPTLWLAQSEEDARRLIEMGARIDAVKNTGNLKYDIRAPKESWVAELIKREASGRPIIVAGSTVALDRTYEDELVTAAWRTAARTDHNALLVIAPRHPEQFIETESRAHEYKALSATSMQIGASGEEIFSKLLENENYRGLEIIILNTIGDLAAVYGIADIAFVGGSLVSAGGHNPLEPAQFGVPVVMGSSYENFRDITTKMKVANGIHIVSDDVELEKAFKDLLTNRNEARATGERGRAVYESQQGATARTVAAIVSMIGDTQ